MAWTLRFIICLVITYGWAVFVIGESPNPQDWLTGVRVIAVAIAFVIATCWSLVVHCIDSLD